VDLELHQRRTEALRQALDECGGPRWEHPCSYLAHRTARDLVLRVEALEPGVYHSLMDLNFRRSGTIVYKPECEACGQCRAIRVPAATFRPNRSQRRCWKRHGDLSVTLGPPELTAEKHALYERYLKQRHDQQMSGSPESLREFLYESPTTTLEAVYRRGDRIVAAGIIDVEPDALSTVYCYYEPGEASGGLGVYNVLWTLEYARASGIQHVYLGYYIRACDRMNYKLNYRPCELLNPDLSWERIE
jgi:arginine-tRNA-protein transferase